VTSFNVEWHVMLSLYLEAVRYFYNDENLETLFKVLHDTEQLTMLSPTLTILI